MRLSSEYKDEIAQCWKILEDAHEGEIVEMLDSLRHFLKANVTARKVRKRIDSMSTDELKTILAHYVMTSASNFKKFREFCLNETKATIVLSKFYEKKYLK